MTQPPFPLRTALIGLSSSATTSWASTAHLPGLRHPRGRDLFAITALCNSSVDAARAAVRAYDLPESTKAYGSPVDLARDGDVDVVICNTRVDRHYETVVDCVRAGKAVYVEWPVTGGVRETEELAQLARESGSRVAVGLQGRWAPPVAKVREIVEGGRWGRVLSCEVRAFGGTLGRDRMPTGLRYFGEKVVGGNPMTIGFAHMVDYVQSVVGEFVQGTTKATTQIQRPRNSVFDSKTKEVVEEFDSDVPDLIVVSGHLPASETVVKDATLSVRFRRGPPFKDEPAFIWYINCERGEIRLIVPSGPALQAGAYSEPPSLRIHDFENDSVIEESWTWSSEQEDIPIIARSTQRALYAFAQGDERNYTTLESALRRAQQIDAWVEKGSW